MYMCVFVLQHGEKQTNSTKERLWDIQSKGKEIIINEIWIFSYQCLHGKHCSSHEPKHEDSAWQTAMALLNKLAECAMASGAVWKVSFVINACRVLFVELCQGHNQTESSCKVLITKPTLKITPLAKVH